MPGQPVHALDVKVVGRLVQDDDVARSGEYGRERDPATLAAGEPGDLGVQVEVRQQPGVHVAHGRVAGPHVLGHVAVDRLAHRGTGGKVVSLGEHGHAGVPGAGDASAVDRTGSGQD